MSESATSANAADTTTETTTEPPAAPLTFLEKLKASVLRIETEALEEAHAVAVEALKIEHAAITDAESLFARLRAKL